MSPPIPRRRGRPPRQSKDQVDVTNDLKDVMPHLDVGESFQTMPHLDTTPTDDVPEIAQPAPQPVTALPTLTHCPHCGATLRFYPGLPVGICGPCGLSFECRPAT